MTRRSRTLKRQKLLAHDRRLSNSGFRFIAGVDEAGRGPLAGPVVAGAVILSGVRLRSEIDDSKKLSSQKREKAYREIVKKCIVGIGIVDEKVIDRINIYQATKKAMRMALSNLKTAPDYIIVDGNMKFSAHAPVRCIVGGDAKSISIAAASIVAKVTRDDIMRQYDRLYPQYGFKRHKGYPTKAHKKALAEHGPSPIHRCSFRPVRELSGSNYL